MARRVAAALAALALATVVLARLERSFLFVPERHLARSPADLGLAFEEVAIATDDGETLHGWWLPGGGRGALLYCHGNAGNIADRLDKAAVLTSLGFDLLLFDWRGYGRSSGTPSEAGLRADARAAHRYLHRTRGVEHGQIVIWGKSLGGPIAAGLATEVESAALVLESTFTSIRDMAPRALPWLPFARALVRASFDTVAAVRRVAVPVLVIHGNADPTIPFSMGETVYAAAPEPKRWLPVEGALHTDAWLVGGDTYNRTLVAFLDQALASKHIGQER